MGLPIAPSSYTCLSSMVLVFRFSFIIMSLSASPAGAHRFKKLVADDGGGQVLELGATTLIRQLTDYNEMLLQKVLTLKKQLAVTRLKEKAMLQGSKEAE